MKIKKNQVIITSLAILIAVAGYINYSGNLSDIISVSSKNVSNTDENADVESPDPDGLLEEGENVMEPGSVILTSGNVSAGIISEAKLNREQIRAKNTESLTNIVNDNTIDTAAKTAAINELAKISEYSEKEAAIELLLEAKGFDDTVASVSDNSVDVVINRTAITDSERAQIEDIVKRKTGMTADKVTINVCNQNQQ
ncbi:MAG: SpoIIIAH-like family protein [Eubacteriales bacterium]|nr:SpoIIIAH-like family protein [Eubacteriales bacterium]